MKLWERVIERRLRKETHVTDNQFGFMPGRSTMEAIYLFRRVMERYRTDKNDSHLVFIDFEKAYDRDFVESPEEERGEDCLYLSNPGYV